MKKITLFILTALLFFSCNTTKPDENEDIGLKQQALNFSTEIIQCYIESDSAKFKNILPDTLYAMDGDQFVLKEEVSISKIFRTD